jgi:hypothetical protein
LESGGVGKDMKKQWKEIIVEEWWTKKKGKVYLHWKLPTGEELVRLTPYSDIPWIEIGKLENIKGEPNV